MSTLARVIATWFGCGYWPKGPGTVGALGALLAAWLLGFTPRLSLAAAAILLLPAIWAATQTGRALQSKDPQIVVVDEVIGQWIALSGASVLNWKSWLAAFLLFRLFDIVKPPPIRALERLPEGTGIVLDDVMAGIYAALVLWAAGWFNSISVFLYGSS